jgi:hypothetical protein
MEKTAEIVIIGGGIIVLFTCDASLCRGFMGDPTGMPEKILQPDRPILPRSSEALLSPQPHN